jgi:hypothetical protein
MSDLTTYRINLSNAVPPYDAWWKAHFDSGIDLGHLVPDTRLQAIADLVETWEQAYSTDIFSVPPKGEHGKTVDSCSAAMGRFMTGVLKAALTQENTDG